MALEAILFGPGPATKIGPRPKLIGSNPLSEDREGSCRRVFFRAEPFCNYPLHLRTYIPDKKAARGNPHGICLKDAFAHNGISVVVIGTLKKAIISLHVNLFSNNF